MLSPQSLSIELQRCDRITAISSAVQRRPIVLVLGMHRSGTSLCSHLLSALGVDMADDPRGHWERWEIVEFHDRILGLFNRDYYERFHDFALPVAWWADPRVAQVRREIVAFLKRRMGEGYFGFKDPRTVRLIPVWHQILSELGLSPKLVLCLRSPVQVARSLHARDRLDPEIGEYRWLVHMIDFFRYTSNFDFCTVEYEEWFNNPSANVEKLQKFLDLSWQQSEADLALVLSGIIDPSARHDDPGHREAGQPLVRALYKLASRAGQDSEARDQIAYIVSQFVSFQQLQRPLLRAFEDVAKTAAKYPEVERAANELKAKLAEREGALQRAERDAQEHAAAALAMQSEIAVLRDALARAERAEQRTAPAEAMQVEIAALWDSLEQLREEGRQREAATLTVHGELVALRGTLAQAEAEATERAATTAALQGEITALHGRLARAEGEARERATAAATLQAEIDTLQGTLTAARQVGKAAIAAFRIGTVVPARPDEPRGWWRAITRFLCARTSL